MSKQSSNLMENWLKLGNSKSDKAVPIKKPKPKRKLKQVNKISSDKKTKAKKLLRKPVANKAKIKIEKSAIKLKETPTPRWFPGMQHRPPPNAGAVEIPEGDKNCLSGLAFVITGVLNSLERDETVELVTKYGGRVTSAISGRTSYLIRGDEAGPSKLKKAEEKNLPIIDENGFLNLIRKNSPLAALKPPRPKKESPKLSSPENAEETLIKEDKRTSSFKSFTEKYRPQRLSEVIGNRSAVERLKKFVTHFDAATAGGSSNTQKAKRAALISGPPGIGKTSAVYALANDLGLEVIEMNASDVRSRKILDKKLKVSLTNKSLSNYFGARKFSRASKIVLMEEVDGMSSGDYGGVSELILFLKITKFPIICTCNDRQSSKLRSLARHCVDIPFARPGAAQIGHRLSKILAAESLPADQSRLAELIRRCNGDIRNALNGIEFWKEQPDPKTPSARNKDVALNAWEAAAELFAPPPKGEGAFGSSLGGKVRAYFVDQMFVPLLVHENYLHHKPRDGRDFGAYCRSAELLAESDVVNSSIYSAQNFELMPFHAILSCVAPAASVSGGYRPFRLMFPSWLGKNSAKSKNQRLCEESHSKANLAINSVGSSSFRTDYSFQLACAISSPLICNGKEGIPKAIALMKQYKLKKSDYDLLLSISDFETSRISVDTKTKSAFTRKCNLEEKESVVDMKKPRVRGKIARKAKSKSKSVLDDEYERDGFIVSSGEESASSGSGSYELVATKRKTKSAKPAKKRGRNPISRGRGRKRGRRK